MAVTPNDVAVELGRAPSSETEIAQWATWIADARLLLAYGDGDRAGLGDLTILNQDVLDYVVRQAVITHIRRPDDATQVDVTVDATSVSRRYTSSVGRIVILDEWWRMLAPARAGGGAFTITPGSAGAGYGPDPQYQYPNPNHAAYPGLSYPWPLQP